MNTSKAAVVASAISGKIASIIGYCVSAIFLLAILVYLTDWDSNSAAVIVVSLIFLALGVLLIVKGSKIKRRIRRFKRYVSLISAQHMTSIDNLAANTGQSVDFVRNDLQKMINKRFFANAAIVAASNEIVIGGMAAPAPGQGYTPPQTPSPQELEVFTCSGCGASGTKQKGASGSCDYCGSVIV